MAIKKIGKPPASMRAQLKLGLIENGEAFVVVIIAADGTVTVEGPFLSSEAAEAHADTQSSHDVNAFVQPLNRPAPA